MSVQYKGLGCLSTAVASRPIFKPAVCKQFETRLVPNLLSMAEHGRYLDLTITEEADSDCSDVGGDYEIYHGCLMSGFEKDNYPTLIWPINPVPGEMEFCSSVSWSNACYVLVYYFTNDPGASGSCFPAFYDDPSGEALYCYVEGCESFESGDGSDCQTFVVDSGMESCFALYVAAEVRRRHV